MGVDEIEEAFKAGYHCRWHKETGKYNFDPAMAPGDPDGAYLDWLLYRDMTDLTPEEKCAILDNPLNERN